MKQSIKEAKHPERYIHAGMPARDTRIPPASFGHHIMPPERIYSLFIFAMAGGLQTRRDDESLRLFLFSFPETTIDD